MATDVSGKDELPTWRFREVDVVLQNLLGLPADEGHLHALGPLSGPGDIDAWLYGLASTHDVEARPLRIRGAEIERTIRQNAPAILLGNLGLVAVSHVRGNRVTVVTRDGGKRIVPLQRIADAMRVTQAQVHGLAPDDELLRLAGLEGPSREGALRRLRDEKLEHLPVEAGWSIRIAANRPLRHQLFQSRIAHDVLKAFLALAVGQACFIYSWFLLGRTVLRGRFDHALFAGWSLAMLTAVCMWVLSTYWQGTASISFGTIVRQRVVLGALRVSPRVLQGEGLGKAMGRVLESYTIQDVFFGGGFQTFLGSIELLSALVILSMGPSYLFYLFVALSVGVVAACAIFYKRASSWTNARVRVTYDLIDNIQGHETRAVQQRPEKLHEREDRTVTQYGRESARYDRYGASLDVFLSRGPLLLGIVALSPLYVSGANASTALWIGLGGVLLAQRALTNFGGGLTAIASTGVAWKNTKPFFDAAGQVETVGSPIGLHEIGHRIPTGETLCSAKDITFSFTRQRKVFDQLSLVIRAGEKILLRGPSGSGKTTLASLLAGSRQPDGGLIRLHGLDYQTLGAQVWRKMIAAAPQDHDNFIFRAPLSFNLLLGREWPATSASLEEAEALCRELGLGDLLDRMPSGIKQVVGVGAWTLSHGERSRVFVARALLQNSELVVLDESFGSLDPITLRQVMACVRRHASTLLVIAHP